MALFRFRGSVKRKTLAFLGKNPCFFFSRKSKDWRGRVVFAVSQGKTSRFGIRDFETRRFAISFRDFAAEPAVRVAILNLRFENAAIAIFWDAKLKRDSWKGASRRSLECLVGEYGTAKGVAGTVSLPIVSFFFRFLLPFFLFFFFFRFPIFSVFSVFFRFIFRTKTGRHRLRDPFCETLTEHSFLLKSRTESVRIVWGETFYLQLEFFCLRLSFFAYSPLRCLLESTSPL